MFVWCLEGKELINLVVVYVLPSSLTGLLPSCHSFSFNEQLNPNGAELLYPYTRDAQVIYLYKSQNAISFTLKKNFRE